MSAYNVPTMMNAESGDSYLAGKKNWISVSHGRICWGTLPWADMLENPCPNAQESNLRVGSQCRYARLEVEHGTLNFNISEPLSHDLLAWRLSKSQPLSHDLIARRLSMEP